MIFAKHAVMTAAKHMALLGAAGWVLLACSNEAQVRTDVGPVAVATMQQIESQYGELSQGEDRWQVVVCRVPRGVLDPIYAAAEDRLTMTSADVVAELNPVVDYFRRWSNGRYFPTFFESDDVSIGVDETSDDCVERALDQSVDHSQGVLVIADAQHAATAVGGWGRPGSPCKSDCSAHQTRRAVYIGGSDFMPYWGKHPPLDLIEHELGHALDWPHSSTSVDNFGQGVYDSNLDVMSNSAAPRDVFAESRNAPGPLAFNMYLAKWIDDSEVSYVEPTTQTFELVATNDTNFRTRGNQ